MNFDTDYDKNFKSILNILKNEISIMICMSNPGFYMRNCIYHNILKNYFQNLSKFFLNKNTLNFFKIFKIFNQIDKSGKLYTIKIFYQIEMCHHQNILIYLLDL